MIAAALLLLLSSSPVDHYNRANSLFSQGQFDQAGKEVDAALAGDPKLVPALTLKGKLAMALNRFDIARVCLESAARLEPNSPYVQFLLGFFHYVDNDFAKSIPVLERARALNPNDVRTHFYLALSYEGVADPEKARALYERTIELEKRLNKPSPDTHVAFGRLLFTLGEYESSSRQIGRALELDPQSRDGHYETGRLHFERKAYEEAAAAGERALKLAGAGTTDRQIHFLLARCYRKLGKIELAEAHFARFQASGVSLRR
ncbi:MAG TPA: tetratricopeptide repeat protein [Bryobacteraceae bacterium]|nr:tetratricopeptide repeat protein [Bryobacteraceae bacterium]